MIIGDELLLMDSFGRRVRWSLLTGEMKLEHCFKLSKKDAWLGYASVFHIGDQLYWVGRDKVLQSDLQVTRFLTVAI